MLIVHVALLALLWVLQFVLPPFHHGMVARILVLAAYAIGYNVLLGYTGLMSLGHAMFFAAGVYGAGLLVYYSAAGAVSGLLAGVLAGLGLAVILGLLSLRTTGATFLLVTMMFGQVGYLLTLYFNRITLGDQGLILSGRLEPLRVGAIDVTLSNPAVRFNAALLIFGLCLLLSLWLARSPVGRVLVAIRENEERTRMLGYDTFRYKLFALVLSGGICSLSGAAYALLFAYVGNTFASILYSIYPLLWTLLGGAGTTFGPLAGTALMSYAIDVASGLTSAYLMVVGLVLVVTILWFPSGIVGSLRARRWRWLP
ncbi:MAG: branched-chain amino acid ABC transporter permease [Armatimonadota bacterium]|nr:branched-chain amino acid ABC transporter permease [Armatimonadota bacterium]